MEREWESVIEDFEAKGILKKAIEELNGPEYTEDFLVEPLDFINSPLRGIRGGTQSLEASSKASEDKTDILFASEPKLISSGMERPKTIVDKINQMFDNLNKLLKKDNFKLHFDHNNLYQQRDETNPKKICKETITPVMWSNLGLNNYKSSKRTIFSIGLTIFFFQQKYTHEYPSQEYCIKEINALLYYKGQILTPDNDIIDNIVYQCIKNGIFNIDEVNKKIEFECEKKGINATNYLLGIHKIDNRNDGRVTHKKSK